MNGASRSILVGVATLSLAYLSSHVSVHHDGVCGAQMWKRSVFWIDVNDHSYDEFSIVDRWSRAHATPCEHIWLNGTIEQDSSAYWPPLHLAVAQGRPIGQIREIINIAEPEELVRKDVLGRTILHWLVIHPDTEGGAELARELIQIGLDIDEEDADGLSAMEWVTAFHGSPTLVP